MGRGADVCGLTNVHRSIIKIIIMLYTIFPINAHLCPDWYGGVETDHADARVPRWTRSDHHRQRSDLSDWLIWPS